MTVTTQHTDRLEALRELAQKRRESANKLRQSITDLLSARQTLLEEVARRAQLLADIDAALVEAPDNPAYIQAAAEKQIVLGELNAQKALLDRGEAALLADPEWDAMLTALGVS